MRSLYFCFLLFATCALVTTKPEIKFPFCKTVSGRTCIIPFKFQGRRYESCTFADTDNGRPWCPYETYTNETAVPGKMDNCDTSVCPVNENVCFTISGPDTGNTCKFPFTINGQTYNSCAAWHWGGGNDGKTWCSTRTNSFGNHVEGGQYYGFCGPDCKPPGPAPTRRNAIARSLAPN